MQLRLRSEIKVMLKRTGGKVTFDAVQSETQMPFLHQIVLETMRLYPAGAFIMRTCDARDGYSLDPFSDFKIPQGMPVMIPIYAIQRDDTYFPDPLTFDPDRFSRENIKNIKPFTHLPFGSGPRKCIGEKLGLIQMKVGIVKILKDFRMEPNDNTPNEIVIVKSAPMIRSEKGLFVDFIKDPIIF